MTRTFENQDADTARAQSPVPLLIGCTGPSGSGKTFTALRLATGIQKVVGGEIFVIDTEQRRSLHYADQFKFKHINFQAPYSSADYLDALRYAKKQGAGVVIVDSCSHEHDGPGGLLEQHEAELDRMAGNDYGKRDRMSILAWSKPKQKRRALITAITTELAMPVIFCFRAKTGTKPAPRGSADKNPIELGFTSIGADEWLFEMGLNMLFLPGSNGIPTWQSDKPGEKLAIKIPKQFGWVVDEGQVSEKVGERLAAWAKGDAPKKTNGAAKVEAPKSDFDQAGFTAKVEEMVEIATDPDLLKSWWEDAATVVDRKAIAVLDQELSGRLRSLVAGKIGELAAGGEV